MAMSLNRCAYDPAGNLVESVDLLHIVAGFHRRDAEGAEKILVRVYLSWPACDSGLSFLMVPADSSSFATLRMTNSILRMIV